MTAGTVVIVSEPPGPETLRVPGDTMSARSTNGRPWERIKARVFAEETHCWLCGRYVDQTLPPRTPQSRSVDHIIPIDQGGNPLERTNLRLAHLSCNSRRGANLPSAPSSGSTRRW